MTHLFSFSLPVIEDERDDGWAAIDRNKPVKKNIAKTIYDYTRWCWVLLALASLTLQATRTASVSSTHAEILSFGELSITFAFDLEIVVRMLATLPDWRSFFVRAQNWLDVILAVGSSIIQIPVIKDSTVYSWFTIFQLMRFYRVILEVPRMKPLLVSFSSPVPSHLAIDLFSFSCRFSEICMVSPTCRCSSFWSTFSPLWCLRNCCAAT